MVLLNASFSPHKSTASQHILHNDKLVLKAQFIVKQLHSLTQTMNSQCKIHGDGLPLFSLRIVLDLCDGILPSCGSPFRVEMGWARVWSAAESSGTLMEPQL